MPRDGTLVLASWGAGFEVLDDFGGEIVEFFTDNSEILDALAFFGATKFVVRAARVGYRVIVYGEAGAEVMLVMSPFEMASVIHALDAAAQRWSQSGSNGQLALFSMHLTIDP